MPGQLTPGMRVERFEVVERLGEGGFAEVYLATDRNATDAPRVALKVLKPGSNSWEVVTRFRFEQKTIESLAHPHIVQLRGAGLTGDQRPYFAMDYVAGRPVNAHCREVAAPLSERVRLMVAFCSAVQHAHTKGVLHRDLKPSNLLVAPGPDGPVPKVIDFGIAKALGPSDDQFVTRLGQVVGTRAYMSPEQAAGGEDLDTRSDLYALAVVLFEVVTGALPHGKLARDLSLLEWADHLRSTLPPPASVQLRAGGAPTEEVRRVREGLDGILRKALMPVASERYPTVAAFGDDLERWLAGQPVAAHPPTLTYLLRHFARRNRLSVAVGLTLLAGVAATAVVGSVQAYRARRAEAAALAGEARARAAEQRVREERDRSEHQRYRTSIDLAALHLQQGEPHLAAQSLRETPRELRDWEWGWLRASLRAPLASFPTGLSDPRSVVGSKTGGRIAAAGMEVVRVFQAPGGERLAEWRIPGSILRLALNESGTRLALITIAPGGDRLCVFSIPAGPSWDLPLASGGDLVWEPGPEGALLVVSGNSTEPAPGRLERFDAASGRQLAERTLVRAGAPKGRGIWLSESGRTVAVAASFREIEVVDTATLATRRRERDETGLTVEDVLVDEARQRLVVARGVEVTSMPLGPGPETTLGTLDEAGSTVRSGRLPASRRIQRLAWTADGRWVAFALTQMLLEGARPSRKPRDGAEHVVSAAPGQELALLPDGRLELRPDRAEPAPAPEIGFFPGGHPEGRGAAFGTDGRQVWFQSWRRDALERVTLPESAPGPTRPEERVLQLPGHASIGWTLLPTVLPGGEVIVPGPEGLRVVPAGPSPQPEALADTAGGWSAASSADGRWVALATGAGVRLLSWPERKLVRAWPLTGGPFRVEFLPGAQPAVLALGTDGRLHHLPREGEPASRPTEFRANGFQPAPLAVLADPPRLAAGLARGGFAVFDLGRFPAALPPLQESEGGVEVTALAFSPGGGRRLAVATDDRRLVLWDWAYALPLLEFSTHSFCASILFSPDGQWLVHTDYSPALRARWSQRDEAGR